MPTCGPGPRLAIASGPMAASWEVHHSRGRDRKRALSCVEGTQLKAWLVLAAQKWEATSPQDVGPFDHLPTFSISYLPACFPADRLDSLSLSSVPVPSTLSPFLPHTRVEGEKLFSHLSCCREPSLPPPKPVYARVFTSSTPSLHSPGPLLV